MQRLVEDELEPLTSLMGAEAPVVSTIHSWPEEAVQFCRPRSCPLTGAEAGGVHTVGAGGVGGDGDGDGGGWGGPGEGGRGGGDGGDGGGSGNGFSKSHSPCLPLPMSMVTEALWNRIGSQV